MIHEEFLYVCNGANAECGKGHCYWEGKGDCARTTNA